MRIRLSTAILSFIILVLIISLGVVYYIGFVKNDNTSSNIENSEIAVIDAVNCKINVSDGVNFKVRLPKISGNSKVIDQLNEAILNEALHSINWHVYNFAGNEGKYYSKGTVTEYCYIIKDDVLLIYIFDDVPKGGTALPASNMGLWDRLFGYDIKDDKILSVEEKPETAEEK